MSHRKIFPIFQKVKGSASSPPGIPGWFSCITPLFCRTHTWPIPVTTHMHDQEARYPSRIIFEYTWLAALRHGLPSLLFWLSSNCIIQSVSVSPRGTLVLAKEEEAQSWIIFGSGLEMLLCLNENFSLRKAKARLQTYRRKSLLSETKTLGVYAGVPVLARIPLRLAEAAEFTTGPELRFEPSGKRSDLFSSGAEMPVNPASGLQSLTPVWESWEACGRACNLFPAALV